MNCNYFIFFDIFQKIIYFTLKNLNRTEKLFHISRSVSQDLASLNIQRGRDHGIPGYTEYRRYCNMTYPRDFDDLKKEIPNREVRELLRKLYGDVRNIDLWPGGMLEEVIEGSKLGPLFMCMIVDQFKTLRDGDRYRNQIFLIKLFLLNIIFKRFWYQNPGVFSPAQLNELKKTSLAKIICENSDNIDYIQKDVFLNAKFPNEMLKCSSLEDVSLEPWRNCCEDNAKGMFIKIHNIFSKK